MKFQKIVRPVCVIALALLSGCAPTYHQYTRSSSTPWDVKKAEPPFSGWDDNGKLKTKSSIQGAQQILGKTLLNEDSIVCESNDILSKKAENLSKYPTGSLFMSELEDDLNNKKSIEDIRFNHIINAPSAFSSSARTPSQVARSQDELKESKEDVAAAKLVMSSCTVNKTPLSVDVIERKPISKIAKIKWNGAEVWTYESHLTFRN